MLTAPYPLLQAEQHIPRRQITADRDRTVNPMASISQGLENGGRRPLAGSSACEACRKLKMRCVRSRRNIGEDTTLSLGLGNGNPCDRCQRTGRSCITPKPGQPGRKPRVTGPFRGINKALRTLRSELQNAHSLEDGESPIPRADVSRLLHQVEDTINLQSSGNKCARISSTGKTQKQKTPLLTEIDQPAISPIRIPSKSPEPSAAERLQHQSLPEQPPAGSNEHMSNPLALLVEASEQTQEQQLRVERDDARPRNDIALARTLLRRPGYVSLGLNLSRGTLEAGLEALFAARASQHLNVSAYFFAPSSGSQGRDVGHFLDPVNLGLVSTEEVDRLFTTYFTRLHPFNGILDPILHTSSFVRSRSALLFTWILALAAQFDPDSAMLSKRLFIHGQKLSKYVYSHGFRSVEIVQGYYISLISDRPIDQSFQETSWMYKVFALGMATELGLHQPSNDQRQFKEKHHDEVRDRIARSEKRTWLRMLTWERAQEAARGRMKPILQCDLSFVNLDSWWSHPLADSQDRNACANVHLRNLLALLHEEIRRKILSEELRSDLHWVRNYVDSVLNPWRTCWLPNEDEPASLSDLFLRFVFMHGRLWTLSFALGWTQDAHLEDPEARTTMEDCFEAAIACCEETIGMLDRIGEPIYCMNAPVWVMISYAAALSLKLFRHLHGTREGSDVEVLALVAQVALHLERAGKTPGHRIGVSAVCGQQLFLTLRSYASSLENAATGMNRLAQRQEDACPAPGYQNLEWRGPTQDGRSPHIEPEAEDMPWLVDSTMALFDPCLLGPVFPGEEAFHLDGLFSHLL
ncbi:hypothetical protein BGZ63DRAFT_509503 [Mariannaea sp. PMI_226]|nr:hypothetical protein BGZ63DRAFT_509503 [Mariannaea sp. PMI_226]